MRRLAGEHISDEEVIRGYPNLMPEVGGLLRGLAQNRAADDSDSGDLDSSDGFEEERRSRRRQSGLSRVRSKLSSVVLARILNR